MLTALIIFHVVVCLLLITVVLLQFGKGAEVGAVMGGSSGSQAIFTSSQSGNIFSKATTALAILFMVNSIAISSLTSKSAKESIFDDTQPTAVPLNSDLGKEKTEAEKKAEAKTDGTPAASTNNNESAVKADATQTDSTMNAAPKKEAAAEKP